MPILSSLQSIELRLFGRLYRLGQRRFIIPLARAFSHSGDGYLQVLAPALLFLVGAAAVADFLLTLAVALLIERSIYFALKNTLKRRRPSEYFHGFRSVIMASDRFSFPSGHSSASFLLATLLCLVYGDALAVMLAWAGGVAVSRVVLGVHFPGDILAGAALGSGVALITASGLGVI